MATIGCLMLLEAASWEVRGSFPGLRVQRPISILDLTSVDKPGCPIGGSHAPKRACNGGKPPLWPSCLRGIDHTAKVLEDVSEACGNCTDSKSNADWNCATRAVGCVTRGGVQEQLSSMVSSVSQCLLRCLLFIGQSSKPTDVWWCVDEDESTNSDRGPPSILTRARGQQQDPRFTNPRMIAYMYLSLVLRPGRMSNEILECLVDSVGTDTEGVGRRAVHNSAEQAALFWSLMLSRAALASMTPLSGRDPEKLYRKQRLVDQDIRSANATLQLQTWPEAVAVLKGVAFVEFEGERQLKSMWEGAVSDVNR